MKNLYKDIEKSLLSNYVEKPQGNAYRRLTVLVGMIYSCIVSGHSSIEKMGENLPESSEASRQKASRSAQVKRWIMSKWTDYEFHYQPFIYNFMKSIVQRQKELILVIDGSETGKDCVTLMVSMVFGKRSIPIMWVTRSGKKGHFPEQMHIDLLDAVEKLISDFSNEYKVLVLGDGEFDGAKWIESIAKKGTTQNPWQYVMRTALDRKVNQNGELYPIREMDIDPYQKCGFVLHGFNQSHAILWKEKGYTSPIPLMTNIEVARMACLYYRRRFAIETLFKDYKSNGFNIHQVRIEDPQRIQNLLIVVALAFLFAFAIGKVAKKIGINLTLIYRKDRINSLSHFQLGLKIWQYCIKNQHCISFFFSKNFNFFICVRH